MSAMSTLVVLVCVLASGVAFHLPLSLSPLRPAVSNVGSRSLSTLPLMTKPLRAFPVSRIQRISALRVTAALTAEQKADFDAQEAEFQEILNNANKMSEAAIRRKENAKNRLDMYDKNLVPQVKEIGAELADANASGDIARIAAAQSKVDAVTKKLQVFKNDCNKDVALAEEDLRYAEDMITTARQGRFVLLSKKREAEYGMPDQSMAKAEKLIGDIEKAMYGDRNEAQRLLNDNRAFFDEVGVYPCKKSSSIQWSITGRFYNIISTLSSAAPAPSPVAARAPAPPARDSTFSVTESADDVLARASQLASVAPAAASINNTPGPNTSGSTNKPMTMSTGTPNEDPASVLERVASMGGSSAPTSSARPSAGGGSSGPPPSTGSLGSSGSNSFVREDPSSVLARVATMGGSSAPTTSARPSAASSSSSTPIVPAGQREDPASVLARVATMGGSSAPTTSARPSAKPAGNVPASDREDPASVLERVASMGGSSAPTTSARPSASASYMPYSSPSSPAPGVVPAWQREDPASVLARTASMGGSSAPTTSARPSAAASSNAPAPAEPKDSTYGKVLSRVATTESDNKPAATEEDSSEGNVAALTVGFLALLGGALLFLSSPAPIETSPGIVAVDGAAPTTVAPAAKTDEKAPVKAATPAPADKKDAAAPAAKKDTAAPADKKDAAAPADKKAEEKAPVKAEEKKVPAPSSEDKFLNVLGVKADKLAEKAAPAPKAEEKPAARPAATPAPADAKKDATPAPAAKAPEAAKPEAKPEAAKPASSEDLFMQLTTKAAPKEAPTEVPKPAVPKSEAPAAPISSEEKFNKLLF